MSTVTSLAFMVAMSTADDMNGTGSCGSVGASGSTCVQMMTSPATRSPREAI